MQSRRKQWLWYSFYSLIILIVLVRLYMRITDDFRVSNITYNIPFHPEWKTASLSPEEQSRLDAVLNQKFKYIGKGAQSYAFVSEDDRYVLKFFKFKHLKPSFIVTILPDIPPFSSYITQVTKRKSKKLNSVFNGYKLSYDVNRDESGLLFIQLNPSKQSKIVTVYDKIGFERSIDIGEVVFVLQEKAKTFRQELNELLEQENLTLAKERVRQIVDLYLLEYSKGIYDRDHGVMHNTGFVGNKPIHLDVGKMTKDDRMKQLEVYRNDLSIIAEKIKKWLRINHPRHFDDMAADLERTLIANLTANARI